MTLTRSWYGVLLAVLLAGCPDPAVSPDAAVPGGFYAPEAIAASGRYVLVASTGFHFDGSETDWDPGFVSVIERATRRVVARILTTQRNPQGIAVHGTKAYVVNAGAIRADAESGLVVSTGEGGVDVIDLSGAPALVANIPLGRSAADPRVGAYGSIALDPGGSLAYVGSGTRGDLFSIDLAERRVVRGPGRPIALFPTAAGENGLTTVRSLPGGRVAVLNFNTDELCVSDDWDGELARRTCGRVGVQDKLLEGAIDVAQAPDGRFLVLMTIANALYRVDAAAQPFAVEHAFAKTGLANNRVVVHDKYAYVVSSLSNHLQRVALPSGASTLPFAVLPVGSRPYNMVVTEEAEGALAWVTLNGAHAVAVVRLSDGSVVETLRGDAVDGGAPDAASVIDGPVADLAPDALVCPDAGATEVVGIETVEQVSYGPGAGDGQGELPGVIQGGPAGGGSGAGSTDDVLSLGVGGEIVVSFGDHDIVDGPGADFIVFENPFLVSPFNPFAEPARVAVSADLQPSSFVELPCDLSVTAGDPTTQSWPYPGCAGVHPVLAGPTACVSAADPALAGGDAFDLADIGLKQARYLRITDAGLSKLGNTSKGFDLDAVVLIHHKKR